MRDREKESEKTTSKTNSVNWRRITNDTLITVNEDSAQAFHKVHQNELVCISKLKSVLRPKPKQYDSAVETDHCWRCWSTWYSLRVLDWKSVRRFLCFLLNTRNKCEYKPFAHTSNCNWLPCNDNYKKTANHIVPSSLTKKQIKTHSVELKQGPTDSALSFFHHHYKKSQKVVFPATNSA